MLIRSFASYLSHICHLRSPVARSRRFRQADRIATVGVENLEQRTLLTDVFPYVVSMNRSTPTVTTTANTVSFNVTFSEAVTGVDASDFSTIKAGTIGSTSTNVVDAGDHLHYTITVSGITGSGSLGLNLVDNGSIRDSGNNGLVTPNSAASFPGQESFVTGGGPRSVAMGDLNGDGKTDLALANANTNTVSVLLGYGNGTFQPQLSNGTGSYPYSVAMGDVNGDGKLDLAVTNFIANTVNVLLGNGNGAFPTQFAFSAGINPSSVAMGDVNGDGKLDLAVTNFASNTVSVLLGNGNGAFPTQFTFSAGNSPLSVAIGDVNGDSKLDLAVANANSNNVSVLLGNGNGTFQPQLVVPTAGGQRSVTMGDVNSDGKLDLAVVNANGNNVSVLLGNGSGNFFAQQTFTTGIAPEQLTMGDVNGDGKLDLAVTNSGGNTVSVLLGNGNGTFQAQQTFATGLAPRALVIGDINGDGKPDLAVANSNSNTVSILLNGITGNFTGQAYAVQDVAPFVVSINRTSPTIQLTNAGSLTFTATFSEAVSGVDPTDFSLVKTGSIATTLTQVVNSGDNLHYTITVSGITGDGTLGLNLVDDNTIRDLSGNTLVTQNAVATFSSQQTFASSFDPRSVATGDLNNDGLIDLTLANGSGSVSVLLGNGNGTFQPQQDTGPGGTPQSITTADLNRDGKLDVAIADRAGNRATVLLGIGDGTFLVPQPFFAGNSPRSIAASDLNGDGFVDLVVANYGSNTVSVLLGIGNGTFQAQQTFGTGASPTSVAVGDMNGDGKADLVVANANGNTVSVLLGNGNGTFQSQQTFAVGPSPSSVAVSDVSGDGKLDIVVTNRNYSDTLSVLLGNGDGTFQTQQTFATGSQSSSVSVGDVNGDSKPDLVVANANSNTVSVLLGNGNGTFQPQQTFAAGSQPSSVVLADVNNDGRSDIVVANDGSNVVGVLLNSLNGNFTGNIYTVDRLGPAYLNSASFSHPENTTSFLTVSATDTHAPVVFSKTGGADASKFSFTPETGTLVLNAIPDFENPTDANLDNVYEVQITATDALGNISIQLISFTVTDVPNDTLLVTSVAGNVTITDTDPVGRNNQISVSRSGGTLVLTDDSEQFVLTGLSGVFEPALANNRRTLILPLSNITGSITFNTGSGTDTLTIDLSGGDAIPVGNIYFNGGNPTTNPGDALVITGGVQGNVTYNYTNASDGNVVMSNFGTVHYTGLEPITNTGTATNVVFNLPAGSNSVILGDDGFKNGLSRLSGATFEQTYFTNPTNSLTINPGSTADTISVGSIPEFDATLNLGGFATPFQTITFTGWLSLLGNNPLRAYATDGVGLSAEANLQLSGGNGFYSIDSDADANGVGTYSQASGSVVTAGTFAITAADIDLQGSLAATMNNSLLMPSTNDATIGVEGPGSFNLTDSELDLISIPVSQGLQVQRSTMTGTISLATNAHVTQSTSIQFGTAGSIVTGPFDYTATQYLSLQADWDQDGIGAISTIGGLVTSPNLHLNSGAGITLNTNAGSASITNRISGDIAVTELDSITVFSDGVRTLGGNGSISISAGGSINSFSPFVAHGSGTVSLAANGSGASIGLNQVVSSTTGSINLSADDGVTLNSANSDITTAGILSINADGDSDGTGTFSSSNAGAAINSGSVSITAADIVMLGTINTGSGTTTLIPTNGRAIDIGTNTAGALGLTDPELDLITAGTIQIGNAASGAITVTDNISQPAKNLKLVTGAGVSGTGSIINGSASTTSFTVQQTGNSNFAGIIGGPVGGTVNDKNLTLVKSGSGTLSLSAANTFTGITNVTQGTLEVTNEMSLGAAVGGTIVEAGATLNVTPTTPAAFSEPLTLNGTGLSNAGALRASGHAVWIGAVKIASASTIVQADLSFSIQGPVQNNGFDLTYDQNSLSGHIGTISGTISGSGGFMKEGQGQLTFQAANTYEGITTINAGLLTTASNGTLGNTSQGTIVNIGGSLAVFTSSAEPLTLAGGDGFAGVYGSLLVDNNSNITGPVLLTGNSTISVLNDNSFATVAGVIQDAGNGYGFTLNSFGSVTRNLILSGANTYTGTTTVNSGRLIVNGSLADGPAADDVVVKSAATLGGHGTIEGAVRIQNGGRMIPGFGPGILTTGAVIFDSGSNISVKTGGDTPGNSANNHDQLAATSSVTIGSNVTLNLSLWGSFVPVAGQSFTIVSRTGGTGNFAGLDEAAIIPNFLGAGLDAAITYHGGDGDDVVITVASPAAPTDLALSAQSVAENQSTGTTVGSFSSIDPNAGDTFTYSLVSGTGSSGNASFTIDGSTLKTAGSFDFETKSSYSIRVRTTDQGGLLFEKQFTITIDDVAEDVTAPVSAINGLPATSTTLKIPITISASDPGVGSSGVGETDLFYSTGGAFVKFATLPVGATATTFTGNANTTYWFRSLAKDLAGNIESKTSSDAYTRIGDIVPPATHVTSAVADISGLFVVHMAGTKASGAPLIQFDVYVSIDGAAATLIGSVGAAAPAAGVYSASFNVQGLADGASHSYRFYSRGRDGSGNVEAAPPSGDVTVTRTFAAIPLTATGIDVQNGANQRSFVQHLDVVFSNTTGISDLINNGRVKVERFDIAATSVTPGTGALVSGATVSQQGNKLKLDFGSNGIGGVRQAGNGFYRILLDMDGNGSFSDPADSAFEFHRLFGDATGDGIVDAADTAVVTSQIGRSGLNLDGDLDGNGTVNSLDRLFTIQQKNKKLSDFMIGLLDD